LLFATKEVIPVCSFQAGLAPAEVGFEFEEPKQLQVLYIICIKFIVICLDKITKNIHTATLFSGEVYFEILSFLFVLTR
jgi:hypothetical protein